MGFFADNSPVDLPVIMLVVQNDGMEEYELTIAPSQRFPQDHHQSHIP